MAIIQLENLQNVQEMRFWQKALGGKGLMRLEALQYKSLLVCMGYSSSACEVKMAGYSFIGQVLFLCVYGPRRSRGS